jgi:hypothetical protein
LAIERERLMIETERWIKRQAEIHARLTEITDREAYLRQQASLELDKAAEQTATMGQGSSKPVPTADPVRGVTTRELKY